MGTKIKLDSQQPKWMSSKESRYVTDQFFQKKKAKHTRNKSQSCYSDCPSTCDEQTFDTASNSGDSSHKCCSHHVPEFVIKTPPKLESIKCFGFNTTEKAKKRRVTVDKSKYKTEMCRQWSRNQTCSYGYKCQYAHGKHELRCKVISNPFHKPKKCAAYHDTGICPYGIRCKFIHDKREVEEVNSLTYYQKLLTCPELKRNHQGKRLEVFENLSKKLLDFFPNNETIW